MQNKRLVFPDLIHSYNIISKLLVCITIEDIVDSIDNNAYVYLLPLMSICIYYRPFILKFRQFVKIDEWSLSNTSHTFYILFNFCLSFVLIIGSN